MENYFFDDKWSEFIYNILVNLTYEQKLRLNGKELHLLKSDAAIKRFATSASAEQQMVLLTKLGYDWFFGVYPVGKDIPSVMKKAYRQHTIKDTRAEVIQEMIENHVFIVDNKAVALALAMMAQNSHSDMFAINSEFLRMPKLLEQYKKTNSPLAQLLQDYNPNNPSAEFKDAVKAMNEVNEIVAETFFAIQFMESVLKINVLDFSILHFLFKYRNRYVSLDYLKRQLGHIHVGKTVGMRCSYLFRELKVIDQLPKSTLPSYTIKSDGIILLGKLFNMILNRSRTA